MRKTHLTITEAARRLKRSRAMLYRWIGEDRIEVTRVGTRPFILVENCRLPKLKKNGKRQK